jgi:hypothetical protein
LVRLWVLKKLLYALGCRKAAMEKVEDRLVRPAVSRGKLYAVGEITVIPLKVCGTIYIPKYS